MRDLDVTAAQSGSQAETSWRKIGSTSAATSAPRHLNTKAFRTFGESEYPPVLIVISASSSRSPLAARPVRLPYPEVRSVCIFTESLRNKLKGVGGLGNRLSWKAVRRPWDALPNHFIQTRHERNQLVRDLFWRLLSRTPESARNQFFVHGHYRITATS